MIQIVSNSEKLKNAFSSNNNIVIKKFSNYQSFDMYDINIINLNSDNIWLSDDSKIDNINIQGDLMPLKKSIKSCNKKVIVALPRNYKFYYNLSVNGEYLNSKELKNLTFIIAGMLNAYISDYIKELKYDKCNFVINNYEYDSDFYFDYIKGSNMLLFPNSKNKAHTFIKGNLVITTLNILECQKNEDAYDKMISFINMVYKEKEDMPCWIKEVLFLDDKEHTDKIEEINRKIEKLTEEINKHQKKLDENNEIKGILYKDGDDLKNEVVKILENILNEHNDFKDTYEEDYKFISGDTTFIVEIKGINKEVNGEKVSAAYNHLTIYEDRLEEENKIEHTKCLFIVASERSKPIADRKPIKERQEKLARNNNTLIIDTPTFLNIYEDFLNKKITKDEIIKMFKEQCGVIKYERKE